MFLVAFAELDVERSAKIISKFWSCVIPLLVFSDFLLQLLIQELYFRESRDGKHSRKQVLSTTN